MEKEKERPNTESRISLYTLYLSLMTPNQKELEEIWLETICSDKGFGRNYIGRGETLFTQFKKKKRKKKRNPLYL